MFNLLKKNLSKILISTNTLIESFFTKISKLLKIKKKSKTSLKKVDKRITISISLIVFLFLGYFLLPTFYNKNEIKSLIENQINEKYNLQVKFKQNLKFGLLPKPHFFSNESIIVYKENDIVKSNYSRINISISNFFSPTKLKINSLFFKKSDFNLNSNTVKFFQTTLNSNKDEDGIIFKDSKLFYKNKDDDVIFISKMNKLNFSYDKEKQHRTMMLDFKIFNIPFVFDLIDNQKKKETVMNLRSKKIRLNLENKIDFNKKEIDGIIKAIILSNEKTFNYQLDNQSFNFSSKDSTINGKIDFKPFYLLSNLNFDQLDIKKLLDNNSILVNLINSEIFYNKNLNAVANVSFNKIYGLNYLNSIRLKFFLEEGNIFIKNSTINWNNSILINLNNIQLISEKNEITFVGEIELDFTDLNKFFSYYQVGKNLRNEMKKIKFDFAFNLNQKKINLDNLKIDNKSNQNVNTFLSQFNSKNQNMFNRLTFRRFINNFFGNYEG